jgi:hypothetical protein
MAGGDPAACAARRVKPVFIYTLVDPRNSTVFYVGKTENALKVRLSGHICDARAGRSSHGPITRAILAAGLKPMIYQLEVVGDDWAAAERRWIAYYRAVGRLANRADGGQGGSGGGSGNAWRGNTQSREHSARKRLAMKKYQGQLSIDQAVRWRDPEYRARLIGSMTGRMLSDPHQERNLD